MRAQNLSASLAAALLIGLVSCSSTDALPPGALVLHVEGDVRRGNEALSVGDHLEPTDRVRTGDNAFVLLHLSNNHVVKLESNVEVKVAEIVQLDAPRTELALEEQIKIQLSPEERARLPKNEVLAERVAGYRHQRRAGRTHGAESEEDVASTAEMAAAPEPPPAAAPPAQPPEDKVTKRPAPGRKSSVKKQRRRAASAAPSEPLAGLNGIASAKEETDVGSKDGLSVIGRGDASGGFGSKLLSTKGGLEKGGLHKVPLVNAGVRYQKTAKGEWLVPRAALRLGTETIARCLKKPKSVVVRLVIKDGKVISARGSAKTKTERSCLVRAWRRAGKVDLPNGTYGVRVTR